ncbi:uncharacterized protein LOC122939923 [Bufo gargarizans]|uniref:uncharacterized protein LOC122939923 n=1 Tax=Bufo gargarizans TaxID=30331 RepID=UPI001CF29990|nr:uncharacterized protein LOC122939923 [Bufo gargarizans]
MSTRSLVDLSVTEHTESHPAPKNSDMQEAESMLTEEQAVRFKRVIKPTQKIRENFEATKEEFSDNLNDLWQRTEHYIAALLWYNNDPTKLTTTLNRLTNSYVRYQRLSAKYITFLSDSDFDEASDELSERKNLLEEKDAIVQDAKSKAELRIAHLQEARSHRSTSSKHTKYTLSSSKTSRSGRSALHDKLIEVRAEAEEASVRTSFAKKEAEITKKKAEMEAETEAQLKILQTEREEAATLAKLKVLEQALGQGTDQTVSSQEKRKTQPTALPV